MIDISPSEKYSFIRKVSPEIYDMIGNFWKTINCDNNPNITMYFSPRMVKDIEFIFRIIRRGNEE